MGAALARSRSLQGLCAVTLLCAYVKYKQAQAAKKDRKAMTNGDSSAQSSKAKHAAPPPMPTRQPPRATAAGPTQLNSLSSAIPPMPSRQPPRTNMGQNRSVPPPMPSRPPPTLDDPGFKARSVLPSQRPQAAAAAAQPTLPKVDDENRDLVELWICLDFEWTCDEGTDRKVKPDESEIIEFSFAIYDVTAGKCVRDGQYYIKPERTPITAFCTELTGISDETLKDAGSLADALNKFDKCLEDIGAASKRCCAVAHGSADLELILPMHCKYKGLKVPAALEKYVDLRLATQRNVLRSGEKARAATLRQICGALGVEMIGEEHCGLDDSWMVMMSTQQLLVRGAEMRMIDIVGERQAFIAGRTTTTALCLDGIPFHTLFDEFAAWLETLTGHKLSAMQLLVVLGPDGRPTGRAIADFGSHSAAVKALEVFGTGRVMGCKFDGNASGGNDAGQVTKERLVLARPVRQEELELPIAPTFSPQASRPALSPFPIDVQSTKGVCYAFQRGACDLGDNCRFSHVAGTDNRRRQICFDFQKGRCTRGDECRFSHSEKPPEESQSQPMLCFGFRQGNCIRGTGCPYLHEHAA